MTRKTPRAQSRRKNILKADECGAEQVNVSRFRKKAVQPCSNTALLQFLRVYKLRITAKNMINGKMCIAIR